MRLVYPKVQLVYLEVRLVFPLGAAQSLRSRLEVGNPLRSLLEVGRPLRSLLEAAHPLRLRLEAGQPGHPWLWGVT